MLQSGQKSYYDDYIRKKGSSRIIHDPPSLLTDRGAYVNFLEVQLERVSAACLGVQSYDQRFNDMQSFIVHLEERIAGTTRLLALSQQCGEEFQAETNKRIESISGQVHNEHNGMLTTLQAMSDRISSAEKSISNLYGIFPRMESMEIRMLEFDNRLKSLATKQESSSNDILKQLAKIEAYQNQNDQILESMKTIVSKQQFELSENDRKSANLLLTVENSLKKTIQNNDEELRNKLSGISLKLTCEIDRLEKDARSNEEQLKEILKQQREMIADDIDISKQQSCKEIEQAEKRIIENIYQEVSLVKTTQNEFIRSAQDAQQEMSNKLKTMDLETINKFQSVSFDLYHLKEEIDSSQRELQTLARQFDVNIEGLQESAARSKVSLEEAIAKAKEEIEMTTSTKISEYVITRREREKEVERMQDQIREKDREKIYAMIKHTNSIISDQEASLEGRLRHIFNRTTNNRDTGRARSRDDFFTGHMDGPGESTNRGHRDRYGYWRSSNSSDHEYAPQPSHSFPTPGPRNNVFKPNVAPFREHNQDRDRNLNRDRHSDGKVDHDEYSDDYDYYNEEKQPLERKQGNIKVNVSSSYDRSEEGYLEEDFGAHSNGPLFYRRKEYQLDKYEHEGQSNSYREATRSDEMKEKRQASFDGERSSDQPTTDSLEYSQTALRQTAWTSVDSSSNQIDAVANGSKSSRSTRLPTGDSDVDVEALDPLTKVFTKFLDVYQSDHNLIMERLQKVDNPTPSASEFQLKTGVQMNASVVNASAEEVFHNDDVKIEPGHEQINSLEIIPDIARSKGKPMVKGEEEKEAPLSTITNAAILTSQQALSANITSLTAAISAERRRPVPSIPLSTNITSSIGITLDPVSLGSSKRKERLLSPYFSRVPAMGLQPWLPPTNPSQVKLGYTLNSIPPLQRDRSPPLDIRRTTTYLDPPQMPTFRGPMDDVISLNSSWERDESSISTADNGANRLKSKPKKNLSKHLRGSGAQVL